MQSSHYCNTIWTYFSDNKERNKENYERDDRKNMIYRICVWTPTALPPNAGYLCSECRKKLEPGEAAGCFTPDRHHLTEPEQQILCYLKYWQIIIYNNTNLEM